MNVNIRFQFTFWFCVFMMLVIDEGVAGDEDNNQTSMRAHHTAPTISSSAEIGRNQSELAEGPPDSHEAMNNREFKSKPKLTIGSGSSSNRRRKRSYEFLMGLVKRNSSLYQIRKNDPGTNRQDHQPSSEGANAKASELLLELLVKIASSPEEWAKVHEMLQEFDTDLIKSKQLVDYIKLSPEEAPITPQYETTKFPTWHPHHQHIATKASSYQKNFAYHRVTGNPLVHSMHSPTGSASAYIDAARASSNNKNTKAYIAVSVIAPKPSHDHDQGKANADADADDLTLENELRELKPWSHQQNLKNMADIRTRWIIQNDNKP